MFTTKTTRRNPLRRLRRERPVDVDPADMGTCFGLDLSLDDPIRPTPEPQTISRAWWAVWPTRKVVGA